MSQTSRREQRNHRKVFSVLGVILFGLVLASCSVQAYGECLKVSPDPALRIDPDAVTAMAKANLQSKDFYRVMQIVAHYETNSCWAGATGNFDGQWLSLGVMQWNFGRDSLQPMLALFRSKFHSEAELTTQVARLMPNYGSRLLARSCTAIPIEQTCKTFLMSQYDANNNLLPGFKAEADRLFESDLMRQIQVDYFARRLTSVLDDLNRLFHHPKPEAWQVAWAMDLKTQQGRFPTDRSIAETRNEIMTLELTERKKRLTGIVEWYKAQCDAGDSDGVKLDCDYNFSVWNNLITNSYPAASREEAVHLTYLVSRTAANQDGSYQADSFQRRAAIAFSKGSVHGNRVDFSQF
jgi:hypothetical protein